MVGVIMASVLTAKENPTADMFQRIDTALAHLEAGLPL
jgi:hypothetical protein